mmetsp:Transcript_20878/g.40931  ORF Transcript_20878/g.40931 Transcript_20878/m.40931 type:complete len:211 (+) Transcript_20878:164-796(+)
MERRGSRLFKKASRRVVAVLDFELLEGNDGLKEKILTSPHFDLQVIPRDGNLCDPQKRADTAEARNTATVFLNNNMKHISGQHLHRESLARLCLVCRVLVFCTSLFSSLKNSLCATFSPIALFRAIDRLAMAGSSCGLRATASAARAHFVGGTVFISISIARGCHACSVMHVVVARMRSSFGLLIRATVAITCSTAVSSRPAKATVRARA